MFFKKKPFIVTVSASNSSEDYYEFTAYDRSQKSLLAKLMKKPWIVYKMEYKEKGVMKVRHTAIHRTHIVDINIREEK